MLGTRNGKQIRDRFINVLDPEIRKGKFTDEEDRKLIVLFKQNGPKWATIAKYYPNRTADMIKNRFHSSIKKKLGGDPTEKSFNLKECKEELTICKNDYSTDASCNSLFTNSQNFCLPSYQLEAVKSDIMMKDLENENRNSTISSRVCDSDFYSSNNFTYDFAAYSGDVKQENTFDNNENTFNWNFEEYFSI